MNNKTAINSNTEIFASVYYNQEPRKVCSDLMF